MATATVSTTQIQSRTPQGKFVNEPFTDFSHGRHAHEMEEALGTVGDQLGRRYPLIVGGERRMAGAMFESRNPAKPSEVVGVHPRMPMQL